MAIASSDMHWINSEECTLTSDCLLASGTELNQRVISGILYPGEYQLIIYDSSTSISSMSCTPFLFGSIVTFAFPTETEVSCPVTRLPVSLNEPGYLTSDGFLFWSGQVYLQPTEEVYYINVCFILVLHSNSNFYFNRLTLTLLVLLNS